MIIYRYIYIDTVYIPPTVTVDFPQRQLQAPAILEVGARVRSYFHTSDGSLSNQMFAIFFFVKQHGVLLTTAGVYHGL